MRKDKINKDKTSNKPETHRLQGPLRARFVCSAGGACGGRRGGVLGCWEPDGIISCCLFPNGRGGAVKERKMEEEVYWHSRESVQSPKQ